MGVTGSSAAEPLFPFEPDELLQRIPELSVRLWPDGSTFFQDYGWQLGHHTLRVLEAFSKPASFREVMEAMESQIQGPQDWADLVDTIRGLYTLRVLDHVDRAHQRVSSRVGFDAPGQHINMLNDRARTEAYLRAIPEVVRPGDTVVEIGTGSGILSMAAARAGARHVYTIEAGTIGKSAEAVFEANGFADRITLIPGRSSHVTIPERADVLISEIIGNEPFQERVLESTLDAIQRFLVPAARLVPQSIRVYAVPVRVPSPLLASYFFTESTRARWNDWYGVDFSPLDRGNPPASMRIFQRPQAARDWIWVSEPALLTTVDFASGHPPNVDCEARVISKLDETVNGIITFFDLQLTPAVSLSTNPTTVDAECSWQLPVWILSDPIFVRSGDALTIRYTYPATIDHRITISK